MAWIWVASIAACSSWAVTPSSSGKKTARPRTPHGRTALPACPGCPGFGEGAPRSPSPDQYASHGWSVASHSSRRRCSQQGIGRLSRWCKPREAPLRGRFVEPLPRPFHDHEHPARSQCCAYPIGNLIEVHHVVERRARNHGVRGSRQLVVLEHDPVVTGALGRVRVDPDGVVALAPERRDEPAQRPAPDLDHHRGGGRQVFVDERPRRSQPAFVARHVSAGSRGDSDSGSAVSSCASAVAQPPSRIGCTFTQTRLSDSFNSRVPARPGIRRCQ